MTKKKWVFPSESRLGVYHTVRDIDGQIVCDCPDFRYQPKPCRHARLVLNGLAEDFPVEGPRIVETNISKPVLAADTVFIPFHDDSETVRRWIIKRLLEFGVSDKQCEAHFGIKMAVDDMTEGATEERAPAIHTGVFALAGVPA